MMMIDDADNDDDDDDDDDALKYAGLIVVNNKRINGRETYQLHRYHP